MIEIEIINFQHPDMEEFLKFRGIIFNQWLNLWDSLSSHEKEIYSHPVYVMSWVNARKIHANDEISVFIFYSEGEFIGAIPFTIKTIPSKLELCCYLKSPLVELGSTVAIPEKLRIKVFNKLFQTPLINGHKPIAITFDRIDETNSFVNSKLEADIRKTDYTRNIIDLSNGYQSMLQKRSSHFRKNLKNISNKFTNNGESYIDIIRGKNEIVQAFDYFTHLEMKGWKADSERAMLNNRFVFDFYRNVILGFSDLGKTVLFKLRIGNIVVAMYMCIMVEDVLYGLKTTYNEEYEKLSPGSIILDRIFNNFCPSNSIKQFNSMSQSPWLKDKWHPEKIETYKTVVFPDNYLGRCYKYGYKLIKK